MSGEGVMKREKERALYDERLKYLDEVVNANRAIAEKLQKLLVNGSLLDKEGSPDEAPLGTISDAIDRSAREINSNNDLLSTLADRLSDLVGELKVL